MAFRYDVLNLQVLDNAKEVFAKPSTQWTADERKRAMLIIEAMRIVVSQSIQDLNTPHLNSKLEGGDDERRVSTAQVQPGGLAVRDGDRSGGVPDSGSAHERTEVASKDKKREHVLEPCDQTVQCSVCRQVEWMDEELSEECPGPPSDTTQTVETMEDMATRVANEAAQPLLRSMYPSRSRGQMANEFRHFIITGALWQRDKATPAAVEPNRRIYLKNGLRVLGVTCSKCGHEETIGESTDYGAQLRDEAAKAMSVKESRPVTSGGKDGQG
jgi:hypothetical protein